MQNRSTVLAALLVVGATGTVSAAEMKVKPGKWEFASTTTMAMMGAPRTHTMTQCINESGITPETMMEEMAQGCELLDSNTSSQTMTWKVKCAQEGGEMTGEGQVVSGGDTLKGGMKMNMSFNGQAMNMSVEWSGKHIGACE
ncbi:MAG: DUF3617 family protein [Pseudomonadota bacterium]